jgi:hypothetical protein
MTDRSALEERPVAIWRVLRISSSPFGVLRMTMLYSPSDIPTSSSGDAVSTGGVQAMYGTTYADMVERLFCKYECVLSLPDIVDIVRDCRHDLAGAPAGALPELTERLAWHRIADLVSTRGLAMPGGL